MTSKRHSTVLQWGRNFIVAEIFTGNDVKATLDGASMGPQLYRCGNYRAADQQWYTLIGFNGAATLSLRKWQNGPRR